jgi:hypothetical protein
MLRQTVRAALHAREDQHLPPVAGRHQVDQQVALAPAVDRVHALRDEFGLGVAPGDIDQRRCMQQTVGELTNLVREGGGEEQILASCRQQREDAPNVADETHVQHAVGFVEHQDLDLRQTGRLLLQVIEQATRRRDQDIDTPAQRVDLRVDVDATVDQRRPQGQMLDRRCAHSLRSARRVRCVGVRINARTAPRRLRRRSVAGKRSAGQPLQQKGSVKPAVLPVPVCAPASTSRPARMTGMACACTGVGSL